MVEIPEHFAQRLRRLEPDRGPRWLAELPAIAARRLAEWELRPLGTVWHGYVGIVLPVRRADGSAAALKLAFPHQESAGEGLALSTWDGDGAVRLLERSERDSALLLELADADRDLEHEPIDVAVRASATLVEKLTVPAPPGLRTQRDEAARQVEELPGQWQALGRPVPRSWLARALDIYRALGPGSGSRLVNEDLHYLNVLRGTGSRADRWLAIDPKPLAGDPEYGVIPLLWNRFAEGDPVRRLDTLVELAGLDRDRARAWTFARAVQNSLWERSVGSTEAARICDAIAAALLPGLPAGVG